MACKSYKNLFESIKKKARKNYYSEKTSKYKHNAIKLKSSNLPRRITVNEVDIFDERKIANQFDAFFSNIGRKLAS